MNDSPLRIIFMGTPDFAVPTLDALLAGPDEVIATICQPDRPKGRGRIVSAPPVKECTLAAGIPVLQPAAIRGQEFCDQLAALKPDLIVVAAYGRILPGHLLNLPRYGTINVHGSILPKYRGAAPIQWAVINGDQESGVTIMQMDEGMDTGAILHIETIPIAADDTAGSMFKKIAELGARALPKVLDKLRTGQKLEPRKQDDRLATPAPLLEKKDGEVDWNKPAKELSCLIRGMDPWPSAYSFLNKRRLRLFKPTVLERISTETPGTILAADAAGLLVATGSNCLLVQEIQPEGSRRMAADAFCCGNPVPPGTRLG